MPGLISPISSSIRVPLWAASNLPIFRSVAPVNAPRSWPNNSLASSSADRRRTVQADEDVIAAGAGIVDGPGDQLLAHAAFAADEHGGVAGRRPADLVGDLLDGRAVADHAALHAQPLAELHVLGADLGEVLRQFLAALEVLQGHGHGVRHGEGEFQLVGIGDAGGVGRIEMDQAEDAAAAADRRR